MKINLLVITKRGPFDAIRPRKQLRIIGKKPASLKLAWLEAQMEFFHKAMPRKAKKIRDRLKKGKI